MGNGKLQLVCLIAVVFIAVICRYSFFSVLEKKDLKNNKSMFFCLLFLNYPNNLFEYWLILCIKLVILDALKCAVNKPHR